ncbi:hypothetical protein AAIH25_10890 [Arthrobacter crystallopoietes]|uniref:hypothetical protein n=1 Tax=Crystallibacter crystallopoietes TaxID=37928 RepID=UPI003D21F41A
MIPCTFDDFLGDDQIEDGAMDVKAAGGAGAEEAFEDAEAVGVVVSTTSRSEWSACCQPRMVTVLPAGEYLMGLQTGFPETCRWSTHHWTP